MKSRLTVLLSIAEVVGFFLSSHAVAFYVIKQE